MCDRLLAQRPLDCTHKHTPRMLALRTSLKPYRCTRVLSRHLVSPRHPFPLVEAMPTPVGPFSDLNMDLYRSVRVARDKVWSRDKLIAQKPREGRKLTLTERIGLLQDKGSKVLRIGTLAGLGMSYGDVLNASNEIALVSVSGEMCMVSGNDWTFKGGTIYPIGVKKQLRGQEIALQNRLPCIYLADSGGAFLPLQVSE